MVSILLVEDNHGDVMLVKEALAAHHIENKLQILPDGQQAVALVRVIGKDEGVPCPDIMLLDMNLPKADGVAVLAAFRENGSCAGTPVIVVSSSDSAREQDRLASLGISHYFRKPTDLAGFMKLGGIVKSVLDSRPSF